MVIAAKGPHLAVPLQTALLRILQKQDNKAGPGNHNGRAPIPAQDNHVHNRDPVLHNSYYLIIIGLSSAVRLSKLYLGQGLAEELLLELLDVRLGRRLMFLWFFGFVALLLLLQFALFVHLLVLLLFLLAEFLLLAFAFQLHSPLLDLLLAEEVLTCLHLDILQSRLLLGRERSVLLLLNGRFLLSFDLHLLELRQKSVPVLFFEGRILHQLSFDH